MSEGSATDRVTVQQVFKFLLRTEKDYPCDLRSERLVGIISSVYYLSYNQVLTAFHELESRGFLEVARVGSEIKSVSILKRDWTVAPKSVI